MNNDPQKLRALCNLSEKKLMMLKEIFVKNAHLRFKREMDALRHMPYGTAAVYAENREVGKGKDF
jgi:hypothetical protein